MLHIRWHQVFSMIPSQYSLPAFRQHLPFHPTTSHTHHVSRSQRHKPLEWITYLLLTAVSDTVYREWHYFCNTGDSLQDVA